MDRLLGVVLVLVSAMCFGANPLFARLAYADGVAPLTFLFVRFAIAAIFLMGVMAVKRTPYPTGRILNTLILLGIWGMAGSALCYYIALAKTSASLVVVLVYTYPALVMGLAVVLFRKRLAATALAALALALGGIVCTVGPQGGGNLPGIALSLTTAAIFAAYILFGSLAIRRAGYLPASTVISGAATVIFGIGALVQGITWPTTATCWLAIILSAVLSTFLGGLAFSAGLERIDSSVAAMLSTVEVVVAVGLSVAFLGETLSALATAGAVMVLAAAVLLARMEMRAVRAVPAAVILEEQEPVVPPELPVAVDLQQAVASLGDAPPRVSRVGRA